MYVSSVYVGNLNYAVTEGDIRSLFETVGAVSKVSLITDRDTGRPKGFAFVEMDNAEDAIERLNGQELMGRALKVNAARPKADKPKYKDNYSDRSYDNRGSRDDRGGYGGRSRGYDR